MQQTRLKQVKRSGDLQLSGEITNYEAFNKGIGSDGYSSIDVYKRQGEGWGGEVIDESVPDVIITDLAQLLALL